MTHYDLAVVGGGPAGMSAAAAAVRGGLTVVLLDAGPGLGGQFWRQPAPPAGSDPAGIAGSAASGPAEAIGERDTSRYHHDLGLFRRLRGELARARADGLLTVLSGHHVWTCSRTAGEVTIRAVDKLSAAGRDIERIVTAGAVVLAPGAYDRQVPFPGWDLPGVMTAGGMQALLKANGVTPGRRVAIGGTGPFLLPVAAGLAASGSTVVGVFEAGSALAWARHAGAVAASPGKIVEGVGYAATLARHRVPYRQRAAIVAAHGTHRVESVSVGVLRPAGTIDPATVHRVPVDAVGVGWGFTPQLELPMALGVDLVDNGDGSLVVTVDDGQRTSVPGVYVAGEACGIGGAALAVAEGAVAGRMAWQDAGVRGRRDGTETDGAAPDGAATDRAAPDGAATDGAATDRAATDGAAPEGAERTDAAVRRGIRRMRRFAAAIEAAHPVPAFWRDLLEPETVVCRCEEVDMAAIAAAHSRHGAADTRQVKELTRAGMGWCQGRTCGFAVDCLMAGLTGAGLNPQPASRPVAAPVRLGSLTPRGRERNPAPDS